MAEQDAEPRFKVLQECFPQMLNSAEQEWIAKGRLLGWRLCNATDGGEGGHGFTSHVKQRLSEISRQKWRDPSYRSRWEATYQRKHGQTLQQRKEQRHKSKQMHSQRVAEAQHKKTIRRERDRLFESLTLVSIGNTVLIPLTCGKYARVDAPDAERVTKYRWFAKRNVNGNWAARRKESRQPISMFRQLWPNATTRPKYRNGNTLDYRRSNVELDPPPS